MISMNDRQAARQHAEMCARALGDMLREGFGSPGNVAWKSRSPADVVTMYDRDAEEALRDSLGAFAPSFGFYGEEFGAHDTLDAQAAQIEQPEQNPYWLVDPIDGTGHYVRGLPFCTSMIALVENGRVVASVIYDFVRDEMYSAALGCGATCEGVPIAVSSRSLDDAYLSVEMDMTLRENYDRHLRIREHAVSLTVINCGWDFGQIARGCLDGRIMKDPWGKDWDYAPGSLLVSEAGGVAANIGAEPTVFDFSEHDMLITNRAVYEGLTTGEDPIFPLLPIATRS